MGGKRSTYKRGEWDMFRLHCVVKRPKPGLKRPGRKFELGYGGIIRGNIMREARLFNNSFPSAGRRPWVAGCRAPQKGGSFLQGPFLAKKLAEEGMLERLNSKNFYGVVSLSVETPPNMSTSLIVKRGKKGHYIDQKGSDSSGRPAGHSPRTCFEETTKRGEKGGKDSREPKDE